MKIHCQMIMIFENDYIIYISHHISLMYCMSTEEILKSYIKYIAHHISIMYHMSIDKRFENKSHIYLTISISCTLWSFHMKLMKLAKGKFYKFLWSFRMKFMKLAKGELYKFHLT